MGEAKRRKQILGDNYGKVTETEVDPTILFNALIRHRQSQEWIKLIILFLDDIWDLEMPVFTANKEKDYQFALLTTQNWLSCDFKPRATVLDASRIEKILAIFYLVELSNPDQRIDLNEFDIDDFVDVYHLLSVVLMGIWIFHTIKKQRQV